MNGSFMRAEMAEQPDVLQRLIGPWGEHVERLRAVLPPGLVGVTFVARGSSDNAALVGRYAVEAFGGVPGALAAPSLSTRYSAVAYVRHLIVALSQSGETPEIVMAGRALCGPGSRLVAITNDPESALARAADLTLDTTAGIEQAVPATKTVTAQLMLVLAVAEAVALERGRSVPWSLQDLKRLPSIAGSVLDDREPVQELLARWEHRSRLQVLGRGLILGAVLEMALKIKETTGVFTQGMSSADFLHGPLAAVDPDLPVLLVDAGGPNSPDIKALDARLRSLRADLATCTVGIGSDLPLPEGLTEALSCLPITIRGQQLAYEWAVRKGRDPDAPVGLSKVTATF